MKRIIVAACLIALPAFAEPHVQVSGGCVKSTDQSNSDEIEFGEECGGFVAAELGDTFQFDVAELQVAGEISHRWKDLHGQNGNGKASADGETLYLTALLANATVSRPIRGRVEIYLLGGLGVAYLDALDDTDWTLAWQAESGFRLDTGNQLSTSLGYRYFEAIDAELDGNSGTPDYHGVVLGLRWQFHP